MAQERSVPYLIDTHILIWALAQPNQLSQTVLEILQDPEKEVWVSSISLFEMSQKLTRFPQWRPVVLGWRGYFKLLNFGLLPVEADEIGLIASGVVILPHKDPFDTLLVAQALRVGAILISKDQQIHGAKVSGLQVVW